MRTLSLTIALSLTLILGGAARADDTTATLLGVNPEQSAILLRALQGPGFGTAKHGGAAVATQWTIDKAEVDESGWLVHGQLKTQFQAFQHRQSSLVSNVISVFSGTRAKKVEFVYTRAVTIEYDAKMQLLGVRMHDTARHVGQYNIAIEGTTSSRVTLPSVAVSGGPFRVQGHVEGKTYRAYATGLPYTLLPVVEIQRHGFGSRKRLRLQFGLRWQSNVEISIKAHGSSSESKAEASIDVSVGGEAVLSGAIATTSQRLTTPISVKATGAGLLGSVLFDEAASGQRSSGLQLAMAMDVSWELAILQHAAVTNFGSVHVEASRFVTRPYRPVPIPDAVSAAWRSLNAGLPLPPTLNESAALAPPASAFERASVSPPADLDAIRYLYRNVAVRKARPELDDDRAGVIGALPGQ